MSRNTATIIRDHLQANDAAQEPIDFAEIASRGRRLRCGPSA